MAHVGQEIRNAAMGARIVFREVQQPDGLMTMDFFLAPGREIAEPHVHPRQTERFTVVSGRARGMVGGAEQTAEAGEEHVTAPGVPHSWWNDSAEEELQLRVTFDPALHTAEMFERIFAWAAEGKVDDRGIPSKLRLAVLLQRYPDEFYPASPPVPLLKAMFVIMSPIGRLLGYRAEPPASGQEGSGGGSAPNPRDR